MKDVGGGSGLLTPDPTERTLDQSRREILGLRELLETRLGGMDKAIVLLQTAQDKVPPFVKDAVAQLESVHNEKFRSIQVQFVERDTRTEQTSRDSKVAVDAALQAAKEAVGEQNKSSALAIAKSETATTKQIDQITTIINAMTNGLNDKIDDIKTRLNAMEGRATGIGSSVGVMIGAGGLIVAIIVAIIAGLTLYHGK